MLKKIHLSSFFLAICCVMGLALSSCKQASSTMLQAEVASFNAHDVPMDLGDGMKITKATVGDKSLIYHISVDENQVELQYDSVDCEENIADLAQYFSENKDDKDFNDLLTLCRQANLGITYEYKGTLSGQSASVTVPANRLPK